MHLHDRAGTLASYTIMIIIIHGKIFSTPSFQILEYHLDQQPLS